MRRVEALVTQGERRAKVLIEAARKEFAAEPAVRIDYIELVDWATLEPVENGSAGISFCCRCVGGRDAADR